MVKALSCDNAASVCGGTVYIVHCKVRYIVVQRVMIHMKGVNGTQKSQVYTISPTADYHFLLDCVYQGVGMRRQQLWKGHWCWVLTLRWRRRWRWCNRHPFSGRCTAGGRGRHSRRVTLRGCVKPSSGTGLVLVGGAQRQAARDYNAPPADLA